MEQTFTFYEVMMTTAQDNLASKAGLNGFRERFKQLVGNDNNRQFAQKVGKSDVWVAKCLDGHIPKIEAVLAVAEACGVHPSWLLFGVGQGPVPEDKSSNAHQARRPSQGTADNQAFELGTRHTELLPTQPLSSGHERMVTVPYFDVEASMGHGLTPHERVNCTPMLMSQHFLNTVLGLGEQNSLIISVRGDSMEPTIKSGARLILDTRPRSRLEGIFALTYDGDLYVKRLVRAPGKVLITSDNPLYGTVEVPDAKLVWGAPRESDEVGILGEVAHLIQPMNGRSDRFNG
ncbi:hypothetical protein E3E12_06145 [Formicincola oecophyllae]|uniref:Peptidase S24/S26A/S26B/S26C domain-containing protein n=1 Tax=Formicincola oecophyllae TaxID=2558361 RepID=A0A4Y6UCJ0_9PROT|nr:S24 family peptidase [Formicincola oecophyllae]QDH13835.2 hypothetical protein E3E12_06145 [Formicincola oecophyllae]